MNKRKLFVVSDIHGHCTILKESLQNAGYDENNANHLLICCGDLFDRGDENREVYEYIRTLKHKVLIKGNHDERIYTILSNGRAEYFELRSGTEETMEEFFGRGFMDHCGWLLLSEEGKQFSQELRAFIDTMVDYFETEHYVFTHGWLPLNRERSTPCIAEEWRTADNTAWYKARITDWLTGYTSGALLADKTIICGHMPTLFASKLDPVRDPKDGSIFYGDRMIAIDAGTYTSKRVNVLVLEEEIS